MADSTVDSQARVGLLCAQKNDVGLGSCASHQAGFPPGTDKRMHIVVDGETCLYDGLSVLFPQATFALGDFRKYLTVLK